MKLTFLGTAAAEGFPALWCRCDYCTVARQRGGRNLRYRSAALINDDLLIDAGPDAVAAAIRLGLDLAPAQALLVTHPHSDHLDPTVFYWRRKGFCATPLPVLHIYAARPSFEKMGHPEGREIDLTSIRAQAHPVEAFQRFEIRTGGPLPPDPAFDPSLPTPQTPPRRYEVCSLRANHAEPALQPLFFALRQVEGPELGQRDGGSDGGSDGGKGPPSLLYATDTGPFLEETWAALDRLAAEGWRFHAAVIDCTNGAGNDGRVHMSVAQMAAHARELERRGLLAPPAVRMAHHFSHNGTPPYEELEELLASQGLCQSYDGLTLTF